MELENRHHRDMPTRFLKKDSEIKAYVHPLRMKILAELAKSPSTISEVARTLRTHPANLTHHFRILKGAHLIRLHEERSIGRNVEKLYATTASRFDLLPPPGEISDVNGTVLNLLKDDILHAISNFKGDDTEKLIGLLKNVRITPQTLDSFVKKLCVLIEEYSAAHDPRGASYSLNLSLYPSDRDYGPLGTIKFQKMPLAGQPRRQGALI